MTASQLGHTITSQVPGARLIDNPGAGVFLRDQLFALGARYPWNDTLERVSGERLNPRYFAKDFFAD
jgi:peptidyl-dipeptidase A